MRSTDSAATGGFTVEFAQQLELTADWLNRVPLDKLCRPGPHGPIVDQAYRLSARILQLQLDLDPNAYPSGTPQLPWLQAHAAGSQLRVVGRELLGTLDRVVVKGAAVNHTVTLVGLAHLCAALLNLRKQ